jgi:hypothetical protein
MEANGYYRGLRWQVRAGDVIPVSLVFEDEGGQRLVRHFGARGIAHP